MIKFSATQHQYTSIVPDDINWLSVTAVVSSLKQPFDKVAVATKCSTRKPGRYPNKWYGVPPEEILAIWDREGKRSIDTGHWYHDKVEQQILSQPSPDGLPVYRSQITGDTKIAPEQRLTDGIYPEHLVYLPSAGICGQSDIVKVQNNLVHITDHKTSKEIKTKGFTNWEGITTMMLKPVQHLQDCEFNHYTIQLSLYMYCILRHNPLLSPGPMIINHVKLKESGKDKWGYPIHELVNNEPIVESITPITIPYLHNEAQAVINWIKESKNRQLITKH